MTNVSRFYPQCYNDYGDIIKATLSKAREINKLNCALAMELAMQALFNDIRNKHPNPQRNLPELLELKVGFRDIPQGYRLTNNHEAQLLLNTLTML